MVFFTNVLLQPKLSVGLVAIVAKGKWSKVLTHNYHDCAGLKHVAMKIYGSKERL